MRSTDFVKVVGLDGDPDEESGEHFECFQAVGGAIVVYNTAHLSTQTTTTPAVTMTPITAIPAELETWIDEMVTKITGLDDQMAASFEMSDAYTTQMEEYERALEEREENPELPVPTKPDQPAVPDLDLPVIVRTLIQAIVISGGNLATVPFIFFALYGMEYISGFLQQWLKRKGQDNQEGNQVLLRQILQAIRDLQYNDEELHLPGSDAYLHLSGKYIQK